MPDFKSRGSSPRGAFTFLPPDNLPRVVREAGYAAYVACLRAESICRRTRGLGIPRATYSTEYARAACEAVWEFFAAQGIEAGTATPYGRGPKDESPVAATDGDASNP